MNESINRRQIRKWAVQMLFLLDVTHEKDYTKYLKDYNLFNMLYSAELDPELEIDINFDDMPEIAENNKKYLNEVIENLTVHKSDIDKLIDTHCKDWDLDRLQKVDVNIMRLAIIEMLYIDDIPGIVAINEAVELGKIFSDQKSAAFINGVLNSIWHQINK